MKITKKTLTLLCVALVLIVLGSCLAGLFNSGNGTVKVSRIKFEGENGQLSGLLYMPKDASADNPKPTVIVTHGYLNSAEMQDANAIELSRRGFVVLALDQYDHGHSKLDHDVYEDTSFFGVWLPFWANSMDDAVQYMYEQPYVLKDVNGNGIIGVTGHSMGGFSSTMALASDEMQYALTGVRKIYAGLTEGSDFQYTSILGIDAATADALGGGRTMGKVAAQYDEFFFNDPSVEGGTVRHKDYVSTPDGMTFLQQTEPAKADTWYETSDGGKRIIYQPAQTHPWNHFSKTTTAHAISFYQTAFADYSSYLKDIDANSQIWQWKEFFECVALVGFILLIAAVAAILLQLPFFSNANTGELQVLNSPKGSAKWITIVVLVIAILLPGIFFSPLMDDGANSASVNILFYAGIAAAVCGVVMLILNLLKEKDMKVTIGAVIMTAAGALLALVAKVPMYQNNAIWTAIGMNSIAYWTIGCTLISLCITSTVYVFLKSKEGLGFKNYGVVFKPMAIIGGLCTALVTVILSYAVLFLMDALFKADFRIWTFAFKTFDFDILPAILRYLPTFVAFYLVSTIGITINTNTVGLKGFWGYLLAICLNAGGAIIWLARQYITLFSSGVAAHPGSALSGIMLVAMVPTLSIAAIFSRYLYKKTGNVWTAAFLNGILMTTMAIANTMVVFK
ncbi:MAG: alpha/beta hydrolase [Anaerolineaceae bacterium]|nr:alpha/beta hydrolase [Anaerolineaceae bacterium]